jgi:hypothetical protein
VTPLWIRRQAYYSYLAGAHHTYGHNDSWRVLPTWKQALDAPGATQLGVLKRIFLERYQWWYLVPDQSILSSGGNTRGRVLNLAARHKDGQWVMVYLGSKTSFSVNMNKITAGDKVDAFWIDPRRSKKRGIDGNRPLLEHWRAVVLDTRLVGRRAAGLGAAERLKPCRESI